MEGERREKVTTADLSGAPAEDISEDSSAEEQSRGSEASEGKEAREGEDEHPETLLGVEETESFQVRWREIQVRFVDEPQGSVNDADGLVAGLMQRLARSFSEERGRLEGEWERGSEVSTEDLRVALKHYRSFFNRLLSA